MKRTSIPDGLDGLLVSEEIDDREMNIAVARRGPHQIEVILRDGDQEFRAKGDLLLASMDVLTDAVIRQWREWRTPDVWSLMRGDW